MGDNRDAQKLLDKYIHNYLIKKNMPTSAEIFAKEANISSETLEFDCPEEDLATLLSSMSYSRLQSYIDAAGASTSTTTGNVPQPNLNFTARNAGFEVQLLELLESLQNPTRATHNPTLPYNQSPTMLPSSSNPRSASEAPIVPDEPDVTLLDSEPSASEFDCPEGDLATLFSSMSSRLQSYADAAGASTSTATGNAPQPNLNFTAQNAGPEVKFPEHLESLLTISPKMARQNPTLRYHQSPTMLPSSSNPRFASEAPIVPDEPDVTQLDSEPSASGSSTSDQSEQKVSEQN